MATKYATKYYVNPRSGYRAALVNVPDRFWRWAHNAELRVRKIGDNRPLTGKNYWMGATVYGDLDFRRTGPHSETWALLRRYGLTP